MSRNALFGVLVAASLFLTPAVSAAPDTPQETDVGSPQDTVAQRPVRPDTPTPTGLRKFVTSDGYVGFSHGADDLGTPDAGDSNANPVLRSDTPHDECVSDNSKPKVSLVYAYPGDVTPLSSSDADFQVRQLWASAADAYGHNLNLRHSERNGGSSVISFRVKCGSLGPDVQPTVYKTKLSNISRNTSFDGLFSKIIDNMRANGFKNADSKYLILWHDYNDCGFGRAAGQGQLYSDTKNFYDNLNNGEYGAGSMYAVNYDCAFHNAGFGSQVFMHELIHTFGANQTSSPNHDGANIYHPRDERDIMAYGGNTVSRCGTLWGGVEDVDCFEDDYWAWWGHDGWPGSWISQNWDAGDCWNRFMTLLDSGGYSGRFCGEEYRLRPGVYQK